MSIETILSLMRCVKKLSTTELMVMCVGRKCEPVCQHEKTALLVLKHVLAWAADSRHTAVYSRVGLSPCVHMRVCVCVCVYVHGVSVGVFVCLCVTTQ